MKLSRRPYLFAAYSPYFPYFILNIIYSGMLAAWLEIKAVLITQEGLAQFLSAKI